MAFAKSKKKENAIVSINAKLQHMCLEIHSEKITTNVKVDGKWKSERNYKYTLREPLMTDAEKQILL